MVYTEINRLTASCSQPMVESPCVVYMASPSALTDVQKSRLYDFMEVGKLTSVTSKTLMHMVILL